MLKLRRFHVNVEAVYHIYEHPSSCVAYGQEQVHPLECLLLQKKKDLMYLDRGSAQTLA